MTTEERTEIDRPEARLEKLEREVGVIAAGEAANAQRISDTRVELERHAKQIGDRVTVLDFALTQKLDAQSTEHAQHKALLEDVQRQVRVIAEGHVANAHRIKDTKSALEQQIQQLDHRVMVLDVKVHAKLEDLEARMDTKLEGLEARIDTKLEGLEARMDAKLEGLEARMDTKLDTLETKFDGLGTELSRIAAHLGLSGASHPVKRL